MDRDTVTDPSQLTGISLLRLIQLTSPTLPIGTYSYSQGLETAVDQAWITDRQSAKTWIWGILTHSVGKLDIPVLARLFQAWQNNDIDQVVYWTDFLIACRESSELQKEDRQLGQALCRLLSTFNIDLSVFQNSKSNTIYASLFALACTRWNIPLTQAAYGYLWAWLENQIAAAVKLVPLGQTDGQAILFESAQCILETAALGLSMHDDEIGQVTPGLAISSALHETQYTRLFRS